MIVIYNFFTLCKYLINNTIGSMNIETIFFENKKEAVKEAKKVAAEKPQTEAKKETTATQQPKEEGGEVDYYQKISEVKTLEELLALKPSMPKDDLDLEIAYSDKKRELESNPSGELFKGTELP